MLEKRDYEEIARLMHLALESEVTPQLKELSDGLEKTNRRLDTLSDGLDETNRRLDALSDGLDETNRRLDTLSDGLDETNRRLDTLAETEKRDHEESTRRIENLGREMRVLVESEITPQLKALAEGHQILLETLAPKSRVEALEEEVSFLKSVVGLHSEELARLRKAT